MFLHTWITLSLQYERTIKRPNRDSVAYMNVPKGNPARQLSGPACITTCSYLSPPACLNALRSVRWGFDSSGTWQLDRVSRLPNDRRSEGPEYH